MISIKFLLVIPMLCKTEWSWELRTWSHKMNLLDILSTSPHYLCRKWMGTTNENSNFDLRVWRVNHPTPCEQNLLLSSWVWRRKRGSAWITSNLWGRRSPNVWACKSCFLSPNCFFRCELSVYCYSLVITEPAVVSARLLGLGSKLCVSNVPRMLNKDLTQFMLCLSRVWQNRTSKRMALKDEHPITQSFE